MSQSRVIWLPAWPVPRMVWHLVSLCALCPLLWGLKFLLLYIFWIPMHLMVALPSGIPLMQFMWHFLCLFFTLRHRCILFLKYMNLHGLLKVKYVTPLVDEHFWWLIFSKLKQFHRLWQLSITLDMRKTNLCEYKLENKIYCSITISHYRIACNEEINIE